MRVSRGMQSLGSGFPIGASSIPVGTRLSLESLVCYTFCCRSIRKKLPVAGSVGSYVGDADILVVSGKIIYITGEQKGYIKYYCNSDRTFSKAVCSVDFALLSDR